MIDRAFAEAFAEEWIAAWNAWDLERIFSHYADDFEMSSPLIVERMGEPSGRLVGKDAIRPYWGAATAKRERMRDLVAKVLVVEEGITEEAKVRFVLDAMPAIDTKRAVLDRDLRELASSLETQLWR